MRAGEEGQANWAREGKEGTGELGERRKGRGRRILQEKGSRGQAKFVRERREAQAHWTREEREVEGQFCERMEGGSRQIFREKGGGRRILQKKGGRG